MDRDKTQYIEQCIIKYEKIKNNTNVATAENNEVLAKLIKSMSHGLIRTNYDNWLEECLLQEDWQKLNNLIFQQMRYHLLPGSSGGYDHCRNTLHILEAFACGDNHVMERILPHELGLTKNGYPFYIVISNLLMAMWYKDETLLQKAIPAAEKFIGTKNRNGSDQELPFYFLYIRKMWKQWGNIYKISVKDTCVQILVKQ